jgi:hypothetical protein
MESSGMLEIQPYGKRKVYLDFGRFDRIKEHSADIVNSRIEEETELRVRDLARLENDDLNVAVTKLEHEWDVDRALMAFFAAATSTALLLALKKNKKFFRLLGVQLTFMLNYAVNGWCPPLALFRRLCFRSQKEIDSELYALKTLRGDFR